MDTTINGIIKKTEEAIQIEGIITIVVRGKTTEIITTIRGRIMEILTEGMIDKGLEGVIIREITDSFRMTEQSQTKYLLRIKVSN